jgi:hypothetical protein
MIGSSRDVVTGIGNWLHNMGFGECASMVGHRVDMDIRLGFLEYVVHGLYFSISVLPSAERFHLSYLIFLERYTSI